MADRPNPRPKPEPSFLERLRGKRTTDIVLPAQGPADPRLTRKRGPAAGALKRAFNLGKELPGRRR